MTENQKLHIRNKHNGDHVKFRIVNDAKQPRLDCFAQFNKEDVNTNKPSAVVVASTSKQSEQDVNIYTSSKARMQQSLEVLQS